VNTIIVGCQNGDEGKGKYTDYFASADGAVVRWQGGPHTGHSVETERTRHKFIQLPSGAAKGATCFIGNGCVVDPIALLEEIELYNRQAPLPIKLVISPTAHVVLPYHRTMDAAQEAWRGATLATSVATGFRDGSGQLGSTKRGVGPCREDKIARIGLRMVDLLDADLLLNRLPRLLALKRRVISAIAPQVSVGSDADWDAERLGKRYHDAARELAGYLGNVSSEVMAFHSRGLPIVFEGAQSVALDVEHGTYPYCSSGYSAASGAFVGTGLPLSLPVRVFGVMKAYTTTVGGGPLPTEIDGEIAAWIRERAREYGTVTGRARRIGWLDLCYIRRAVRLDGISGLCVSCLDVLGGLEDIRLATHYEIDGRRFDEYPASLGALARARPVYTTLRGWAEFDADAVVRDGIRALPSTAQAFVEFVKNALSVPIAAIGVGASRRHTIELNPI
jgi:adenylosuccinate synthase